MGANGSQAGAIALDTSQYIADEACIGASFFSPGQRQQTVVATSEEGYVRGSSQDELRRLWIPTVGELGGFNGQLEMDFDSVDGKETTFIGTATMVSMGNCVDGKHRRKKDEGIFLLTCAHNFVQASPLGEPKFCKRATFFMCRDGVDKYLSKHRVKQIVIHPDYLKKPDIYSGNDIAIASLESADFVEFEVPNDRRVSWCATGGALESVKWEAGSSLTVVGYPGKVHGEPASGRQYGMEGTLAAKRHISDGCELLLYRDVDTTGGQSGSPVYFDCSGKEDKIAAGIHVGHDAATGFNVATAITKAKCDWWKNVVKDFD